MHGLFWPIFASNFHLPIFENDIFPGKVLKDETTSALILPNTKKRQIELVLNSLLEVKIFDNFSEDSKKVMEILGIDVLTNKNDPLSFPSEVSTKKSYYRCLGRKRRKLNRRPNGQWIRANSTQDEETLKEFGEEFVEEFILNKLWDYKEEGESDL